MTNTYHNPATQAERREVLENTLLGRAQADADMAAGGRFKKQNPTEVNAVPVYPKIPSGPWSGDDPSPTEEPLGIDINKMEP